MAIQRAHVLRRPRFEGQCAGEGFKHAIAARQHFAAAPEHGLFLEAEGVNATQVLRFEFNEGSDRPMAVPFRTRATVLELVDDVLVPTRGVYAGSRRHPGRSCALRLHEGGPRGIGVGVSSHAVQCADDDTLRHVGLDPARASVVVVKSRGHFRAGFDHLFRADQIIEVAAPGVATSDLHSGLTYVIGHSNLQLNIQVV